MKNRLAWTILVLLSALGCKNDLIIAGSTCESDVDCEVYSSCALRETPCLCDGGACYLGAEGSKATTVQVGCRECHGTTSSSAPPVSTDGSVDTALPGIGAHQTHVRGGSLSRPIACHECHVVPEEVDDPGHNDTDLPAEVIFGALASAGDVQPTWSSSDNTCVTYCHGTALSGGSNTQPHWISVDGTQAACGSCHSLPPTQNHTSDDRCEICHTQTAGSGQTIANPNLHINGQIEVDMGPCYSCHGDQSRSPAPWDASPPTDLDGVADSPEVGAHLAHFSPASSLAVQCEACHVVPTSFADPGHVDDDDQTAEVVFSGLAIDASESPTYESATMTCSNTYCHGVATIGGNNADAERFDAGSGGSACDACHDSPPDNGDHAGVTPATPCGSCHAHLSTTLATTILDPSLHVDGIVQGSACGGCHDNPPQIGAHDTHVTAVGLTCTACHGHDDGLAAWHNEGDGTVISANVDLSFDASVNFAGGTTMSNGATISYDRPGQRCGVGCHNPIIGNPVESPNLNNRPTWTAGQLECRGCHDEVRAGLPWGHDVGSPDRDGCLECHEHSSHPASTVQLRDPDPTDAHVPIVGGPIDALCLTCHDSGGDRFFANQLPRDVLTPWLASKHNEEGYECGLCHDYHASSGSPLVMTVTTVANCAQSGCHATQMTNAFAGSTRHPVGDGAGEMQCTLCHNPHADRAPPNASADPADVWSSYYLPPLAASETHGAGVDTRDFCIACHTANPPPGVPGNPIDIASVLAGGAETTEFRKENDALHRQKHGKYNCVTCHDWHGTNGNSGNNRQRLLLPYIDIDPGRPPYNDENNCQFPIGLGRDWNGNYVGFTFSGGCH